MKWPFKKKLKKRKKPAATLVITKLDDAYHLTFVAEGFIQQYRIGVRLEDMDSGRDELLAIGRVEVHGEWQKTFT